MSDTGLTIAEFVARRNNDKVLFTAGPASLLPENLTGLRPCFGRGDPDYQQVEEAVLGALRAMTGHAEVVRLQGSASLAIEIAILNFLQGKVLVVESGFYATRLVQLARQAKDWLGAVAQVDTCDWTEIGGVSGSYDWIVSCYTETSRGLKIGIGTLADLKHRTNARLFLDATASIGLEEGHERADVIAYSSCKGLFGLTGASFIAFNGAPQVEVPSLYMRVQTHAEKRVTGPYHAIASLLDVLPRHAEFRSAVTENKRVFLRRFESSLMMPPDKQPLLCTWVDGVIGASDRRAILYAPRDLPGGSIVCHLGEAHLGTAAAGAILDLLEEQSG